MNLITAITEAFSFLDISNKEKVEKMPPETTEIRSLAEIEEIFFYIGKNCTLKTFGTLASCSKRTRLLSSQSLASRADLIGQVCSNMLSKSGNLKTFYDFCSLYNSPTQDPIALKIPGDLRTVEKVRQYFPNIQSLVFIGSSLEIRTQIIKECPQVKHLTIQNSTIDINELPKQITTVSFTDCTAVSNKRMMDVWRALKYCHRVEFSMKPDDDTSPNAKRFFELPADDIWGVAVQLTLENETKEASGMIHRVYKQKAPASITYNP